MKRKKPAFKPGKEPSAPHCVLQKRLQQAGWHQDIRTFVLQFSALVCMITVLFAGVFGVGKQPDASMQQLIQPGDLILYWRYGKPDVQDLVAFDPSAGSSGSTTQNKPAEFAAGIVAAAPGDRIETDENSQLLVNRTFSELPSDPNAPAPAISLTGQTLPEGQYLVRDYQGHIYLVSRSALCGSILFWMHINSN